MSRRDDPRTWGTPILNEQCEALARLSARRAHVAVGSEGWLVSNVLRALVVGVRAGCRYTRNPGGTRRMSDMREGLQPIGGPRLREKTTPRKYQKHRNDCIDSEDGSIDCVCGLDDYSQEKAGSDLARHEDSIYDDDPFPFIDMDGNEVP